MERQFKFYYVYQISNLVNRKIYIGIHATNDMNDGYMGSGLLLRQAIAKYGIEKFQKDILFEGSSYQEILDKEAELVTTEFINREDTYNLREGGNGSANLILERELKRRANVAEFNRRTKTGVPRSEETKRKLSLAKKGRPGCPGRIRLREKGICVVCGKEFEIRLGNRIKGKCCSRQCAGKYSSMESREQGNHTDNKGRFVGFKYIHKETAIRAVPESELDKYIKDGWELGRK